ncbi:MAG: hypothetical protein N5P05_000966 [Chroococcopsis gigantea SAG 12.99]|jgi:hypothetical protein|nr:hypothetical protein [Chlorogloea purpurea SAG 13.99]MDV2999360.1 hypothetical protein [Chroococcopsis gigantea SAG 12.99]
MKALKNLKKIISTALCLVLIAPVAALAEGEVTIEYANGDDNTYSNVEIHNTDNILYLNPPEMDTMLMISKKECGKEGEILVCNKAVLGLDTQGVLEELKVKEIHLFINETKNPQQIQGSTVTLSPGTMLLEVLTEKGTYVNALGKIDSTSKPEGASR